jgi:adenosylhomocysteine nucleosidase
MVPSTVPACFPLHPTLVGTELDNMRISTTVAVAALAATLLASPPAPAGETIDPVPRVAVMSAFEPEWEELRAAMAEPVEHAVNGTTFVTGRLEGKDGVLLLTGISMVNAAMATQLAIERFDVERIVFSGIAGGVNPAFRIGDVVVPAQWGQYLEAVFARETPEGWRTPSFLGEPPFANHGMIFPFHVEVDRDPAGGPERRFWFPADPGMLELAREVAAEVDLKACVQAGSCLGHEPRVVVGGNGVSGQAFVDNAGFREYVAQTFDARVLDMESAAVAHVAYANGVPFIAFRSLSDLAGGGEGENQMGTFLELAADNAATVVRAFVKAMP